MLNLRLKSGCFLYWCLPDVEFRVLAIATSVFETKDKQVVYLIDKPRTLHIQLVVTCMSICFPFYTKCDNKLKVTD